MRYLITLAILFQFGYSIGQEFKDSRAALITERSGIHYTYLFKETHPSLLYQIELVEDTFLCARFHTPPDYSYNGPSHLASYLISDLDCPYDYINDKPIPANGMFRAEFKLDSIGNPTNLVFKESPHPDIGRKSLHTSLTEKMKKLKKLTPAYYKDKELKTKFIIKANFNCP
jgi:hypothetical protein